MVVVVGSDLAAAALLAKARCYRVLYCRKKKSITLVTLFALVAPQTYYVWRVLVRFFYTSTTNESHVYLLQYSLHKIFPPACLGLFGETFLKKCILKKLILPTR